MTTEDDFTLEHRLEVWNNKTGERIEVGEDRDGLELVQMTFITDDGQRSSTFTIHPDEAPLVAKAIGMVAEGIKKRK